MYSARVLSRFSRVQLSATLWTMARQVPLPMGFSRREYWSGLPVWYPLPKWTNAGNTQTNRVQSENFYVSPREHSFVQLLPRACSILLGTRVRQGWCC